MADFLIDHAIKNVWCAPRQDLQAIVQPAKITPTGGVWNTVKILTRVHELPEKKVRFHVFQIGQLHPLLMGLFPEQNRWIPVSEACITQKLIVDIYNVNGLQLPRTQCWYRITEDKNLVFALKHQDMIDIDMDNEPIYIRVYSNAFYKSQRANVLSNIIDVQGMTVLSQQNILDLQTKFIAAQAKVGTTMAFINGYQATHLNLVTVKPGDVVEFVYDASVYKVVDFLINDLRTFDSLIDLKTKYLLHYQDTNSGQIDYQDDIDVYLQRDVGSGRRQGVLYHRNAEDSMRMITHKDYSVTVPYLVALRDAQPNWPETQNLYVRLYIRKGGWDRALVDENHRIKELYKLPDVDIRRAMLGLDSVVDVWRADKLEAAAYTEIMRSRMLDIDRELVEEAYGYNAISKLIANTPVFTRMQSNQKVIDVPYSLQNKSTGFEYDANGHLIGWYYHVAGSIYPARNIATKLVEMVRGYSDDRLDEYYGYATTTLDPTASYRMYVCDIVLGTPTNVWRDVTGSGQYAIINNVLTWLIDRTKFYTLVRSDKNVLAYGIDLMAEGGVLKFSLNHKALRNNVLTTWVMQIPMGQLDLFLNRKSLIEGIDYIVNFPEIVIINKEYLDSPLTKKQHIDVRFSGFPNSDLSREVPSDVGYVQYGLLSRNNRFDIRDDKVLRIVVDGALYDRSELKFSEDDSGVTVPDARNGSPYLIRDIVVPLSGLTDRDTYEMRAKSKVIDKQVSDYLSLKIPEPDISTPPVIPNRYKVYSPFCSRLVADLRDGILYDDRMKDHYGTELVIELCQPYLELLDYDPTQDGLQLDDRFAIVHPTFLNTVVDLDIYLFKFLQKAVTYYLKDRITLTDFVRIYVPA